MKDSKKGKVKMKKLSTAIFCAAAVIAASLLTSCASTPKEPRSIKTSSQQLSSIKKAAQVAENYELKLLGDSRAEGSQHITMGPYVSNAVYIAANEDKSEAVVYMRFARSNSDQIEFVYVSLNGEKTSTLREYMEAGSLILNNKDKLCDLDSGNFYLLSTAYEPYTKDMANIRKNIKKYISKTFGITCNEEINPEQKQITGFDD